MQFVPKKRVTVPAATPMPDRIEVVSELEGRFRKLETDAEDANAARAADLERRFEELERRGR